MCGYLNCIDSVYQKKIRSFLGSNCLMGAEKEHNAASLCMPWMDHYISKGSKI